MLARLIGRCMRRALPHRMVQLSPSTSAADTAAKKDVQQRPGGRSDYVMPAEWERQQRVWMGWPQRPYVWREKGAPAQRAWVQVCHRNTLSRVLVHCDIVM